MLESRFQAGLIKKLHKRFPGCLVLKQDADYCQGIPDLLILYKQHWAALECKRSKSAPLRPNQEYYVEKMNGMSFSRFVFPENEEDILNELQRSFNSRGEACVSERK